ncbi:hypothetical protein CBS101457_006363 [Exobasidium rhododendri]|nr:hypothetical protein CBS101457_006363 [Exobasidium rhododendri]
MENEIRKEFVTVTLERGGLGEPTSSSHQNHSNVYETFLQVISRDTSLVEGKRVNKIPLHYDLWGAVMIRKLGDGATILVARSRGGRLLICSDLLGLLASLQEGREEASSVKIRQSVAIIECGGRATTTEFYTGGWLTVGNGKAAWEIDDLVYMLEVPKRRNSLPHVGTSVWMIPSHYHDEIPVPDMQIPISFMSLDANDVFVSTYLHPAYIFVTDRVHSRWETTILKSVRIIHFAPTRSVLESSYADGEEREDNAMYPLTNANKREHQRWVTTGRRLAQAAENEEEEEWGVEDDWTDDEEAVVEE